MSDYLESNRLKFLKFFNDGCKVNTNKLMLGLEIEHFIVDKNDRSVSYYGKNGIEDILKKIQCFYDEVIYSENYIVGLNRKDIAITLEPAGQIEVSISPKESIESIANIYNEFYNQIKVILDTFGYKIITKGYQIGSKADDLKLIPKERYRLMDKYFEKIGSYGKFMMKGTASTQISIDYFSENDFIKKYFVAYNLSPIFSLICGNSPIFEGQKNQNPLLRYEIWDRVDKDRYDISKFSVEGKINFEKYLDFVFNTPIIVNKTQNGEHYSEKTIGQLCEEREFKTEDIAHCLSMVFPMIRLKNYIEMRMADSMPIDTAKGFMALVKGIFKGIDKSYQVIEKFVSENQNWYYDVKTEIQKNGFNAEINGIKIKDIIQKFVNIARENLEEKEQVYIKNLKMN